MFASETARFLHYSRFEKRLSAHTLTAYTQDLDEFQDFLKGTYGEDLTAADVRRIHITSWLAALSDRKRKAVTINRKLATLKSFFRFLLKTGQVARNPAAPVHALRTPERLPLFLRDEEAERMLQPSAFAADFRGETDRLICEILYLTGLRRSELCRLRVQDVEWSLQQLRVLGKGNKERLVPVSEGLLTQIRAYGEVRKTLGIGDDDHLLVLENGKPLYDRYVYKTVKNHVSMSSGVSRQSPHVLRHSFATHLLAQGANIQAIKDLLGHSSLAATEIYAHNEIGRLQQVYRRTHPRA